MKQSRNFEFSPSEFYRKRRPEYFSDSTVICQVELPREVLAFEINKISSYQKQDLFEVLSRRLSEKLICPNLIPQVGPTGGGDGKTDAETYPVADIIAERWFIPENGWNSNQKWAFAFSAKQEWRGKLNSDVAKIIGTARGYTRIYFVSNQTISSKNKKDVQDELKDKYDIEVIVLDSEWIIENVYSNKLQDIVIESLNLSSSYLKKEIGIGSGDRLRMNELEQLEINIANPKRYSSQDYQLIDDAIRAAVLSRRLEKPRYETEGRFERCERLCKQLNDDFLISRLIYERAWTYVYYYDDLSRFLEEFLRLRSFVSVESDDTIIEWYFNLLNTLRGLSEKEEDFSFSLTEIESEFLSILERRIKNSTKLTSCQLAATYKSLLTITDKNRSPELLETAITTLTQTVIQSERNLGYPFSTIKEIISELGRYFPNIASFDRLVDEIAILSEKRTSELAAGEIFYKHAIQKLTNKQYQSSIVYFGKSIYKLAKEETKQGFRLALNGLAESYLNIDLPWAAYSCYVAANWISLSNFFQAHLVTHELVTGLLDLVGIELFLGRVPNFLVWYQLYAILSRQIQIEDHKEIDTIQLIDACFSIRLLCSYRCEPMISYLPQIFKELGLVFSENAALYLLGHIKEILPDYKSVGITSESDLDEYFCNLVNQPFQNQMIFETQFQENRRLCITTTIVGCNINIYHECNSQSIIISEMVAAFIEGALGTSVGKIFPKTESVEFDLKVIKDAEDITIQNIESQINIIIEFGLAIIKPTKKKELHNKLITLIGYILSKFFFIEDVKVYLDHLFEKEELNERLSIILDHPNFILGILGNQPRIIFSDWMDDNKIIPMIRKQSLDLSVKNCMKKDFVDTKIDSIDLLSHRQFQVNSIISDSLWDDAQWKGVGVFGNGKIIGLTLAFADIQKGREIFSDWKTRFGEFDEEESISISIIKGIDRRHPSWYRVIISGSLQKDKFVTDKIFFNTMRIHEMNPTNSDNLNFFEKEYSRIRKFYFCPSEYLENSQPKVLLDHSIKKFTIFIRNAWEIGIDDFQQVAIYKDDRPVIPEGVVKAPVEEVLNSKQVSK